MRPPAAASSSSTTTALPSSLLVAVAGDGETSLYSSAGDLLHTFSVGHDLEVTHLAVSPSHDEYFIATADTGGYIRVHLLKIRETRLKKDEKQARRKVVDDMQSQFMGSQVNITTTFQKQMQVTASDGEAARLTALGSASQKGNKYLVAGDAEGRISVFTRNGTLRATVDAAMTPGQAIDGFHAQASSLAFLAGDRWGFVELDKATVSPMECPAISGRVATVAIDSQQSTRTIVADMDGTVTVLNLKNKKDCKVEHEFPKGVLHAPKGLASLKGYTIGLEGGEGDGQMSLTALNMSQVGKKNPV